MNAEPEVNRFGDNGQSGGHLGHLQVNQARLLSVSMSLHYHTTAPAKVFVKTISILDGTCSRSASPVSILSKTGEGISRHKTDLECLTDVKTPYYRREPTELPLRNASFAKSAKILLELINTAFKYLVHADRPRGYPVSLVEKIPDFLHLSEVAPDIFEPGFRQKVDQRNDLLRPLTKCLAVLAKGQTTSAGGVINSINGNTNNHICAHAVTDSGAELQHDHIEQHLCTSLRTGLLLQTRRKRITGLPLLESHQVTGASGESDILNSDRLVDRFYRSRAMKHSIDNNASLQIINHPVHDVDFAELQHVHVKASSSPLLMTDKDVRQQQTNQHASLIDCKKTSAKCLIDTSTNLCNHRLTQEIETGGRSQICQLSQTHQPHEPVQRFLYTPSALACSLEAALTNESPDEKVARSMIRYSDQLTQTTSRPFPQSVRPIESSTLRHPGLLNTAPTYSYSDEALKSDSDISNFGQQPNILACAGRIEPVPLCNLEDIYETTSDRSGSSSTNTALLDTNLVHEEGSDLHMSVMSFSQNNRTTLSDVLGNDHLLWHMWKRRASVCPPDDEQMLEMKTMYENDPDMRLLGRRGSIDMQINFDNSDLLEGRQFDETPSVSPRTRSPAEQMEASPLEKRPSFFRRASKTIPRRSSTQKSAEKTSRAPGLLKRLSMTSKSSDSGVEFDDLELESRAVEVKRRKTLEDYEMPDRLSDDQDMDDMLF